ncbi:MAG: hypothetical protein JXA04_01405 [Gammaproteobacteria bacterium]|nr:hypothetical protein [Gammaproteobacteria bacterium]
MKKLLIIPALLLVAFNVSAVNKCEKLINVVYAEVAAKNQFLADARQNSLTEPWVLLAQAYKKELNRLRIPEEKQLEIARSILTLNYSNSNSVEADIFAEYYFQTCELENDNSAFVPLVDIPTQSILACRNNRSSSEFQKCFGELIAKNN